MRAPRPLAALALLLALGGCGVKAPPRAAGATAQAAPNDLFRPDRDLDRATPTTEEPPR